MAWHKRFQPEKSFLEDELETVGMGGSDVVLGSAVSRIFTIRSSIIQCWPLETDQNPIYVVNWIFSRSPDRC